MRPATVAVSGFIGTPPMNLLPAQLRGGQVDVDSVLVPVAGAPAGDRALTLGIRPGDLRIVEHGIPACVDFIEDLGDNLIVNLLVGEQRVKLKSEPGGPSLAEGQQVHLGCAPEAAHLFDRESGERL